MSPNAFKPFDAPTVLDMAIRKLEKLEKMEDVEKKKKKREPKLANHLLQINFVNLLMEHVRKQEKLELSRKRNWEKPLEDPIKIRIRKQKKILSDESPLKKVKNEDNELKKLEKNLDGLAARLETISIQ
ncbi:hypothetical protein GCK72_007218 [Caenorhabditis remanei]|uniref:Uncharacterized protein n=1 Tax=Caenorhabditis remanei TaxID=31234 RepID=A0A6A5HIM6_CAERE|nr:hypothetical protein GCK72_007218 [Caenorhabditis remanei]KAF1767259.1 hypothetical protein GCK72_007218 [Caenorhabditis remanei]